MIYTCITGATSGIGKSTAEIFAQNGHNLILLGRRKKRLEQLEKDLTHYGVKVIIGAIDVRDVIHLEQFFDDLVGQGVQIDILVNNAGLAKGFDYLEQAKIEDINEMIDTNVKGMLFVSKFAIPLMKESGKHIFNIGSISAKNPYPSGVTYCATKAAVNMISECMRLELQKDNIYVTCINPGLVDTEFQLVRSDGDQQKVDDFLARRLGNGEQLHSEDIAQLLYATIGKNIPEISYRHKQ